MRTLYLDTETYSEVPISHGTYRYAASAEVMLCTYAFGDEPAGVIDATKIGRDKARALILELVDAADIVKAHNAMFDRNVLRLGDMKITVPIRKWRCTMVKAMLHGLPGGLDKLCDILNIAADKRKIADGRKLIHLFCKPQPANRKIHRATYLTHPAEWARFVTYALGDITAMRAIDAALPKWNYDELEANTGGSRELELYWLDQEINDRGVPVDIELAESAVLACERSKDALNESLRERTDGDVERATQRDKLMNFILLEYGIPLTDLTKATVTRLLDNPSLDPALLELLNIRQQASRTSTSKFKAFLRGVNDDNRLRGMFQFSGAARTRRDAGRTAQLQNLPSRGLPPWADILLAIEATKAGCLDVLVSDVTAMAMAMVRPVISTQPAIPKKLVISDLANIEGRTLAWLAGESWKLQAFRDYDTIVIGDDGRESRKGPDLYKLAYAKANGILLEDVDAYGRSIGKVMELACFGPETKVLTNNGVKAIVAVSNSDLLWDGISWVQHQGVVERSARQTVNVDGINLTPDHLVLIGRTWTPALELATSESTLSLALGTGLENLPSHVSNSGRVVGAASCMSGALVGGRNVKCISATFVRGRPHGVTRALRWLQLSGEKSTTGTPTSYQTEPTGNASLTVSPLASLGATTKPTKASRTMGGVVSEFLKCGARIVARFWSTLLPSPAGMFRTSTSTGGTSIGDTNLETCASLPDKRIASTNGLSEVCKNRSKSLRPVFDILNAGPRNRFTVVSDSGYLIVHNCGYAGGISAFITFALGYGFDLEEMADKAWPTFDAQTIRDAEGFLEWWIESGRAPFPISNRASIVCEIFKSLWRQAHPRTVKLWGELQLGFQLATKNPGTTYTYLEFKFRRDGTWLRIRLPSGRCLCYPQPSVDPDGQCSYMGQDQFTKKWVRILTHGGKLAENACQSVARDILFDRFADVQEAGYPIILRAHDELVTETPDTPEYNHRALSALLATPPPWAKGFPLAAEGFESYRYKK